MWQIHPGFSTMDMERYNIVKKEHLQYCFREMKPYITQCKFSSARILAKKGCAVLQAVERGEIAQSSITVMQRCTNRVKDKKMWNESKNLCYSGQFSNDRQYVIKPLLKQGIILFCADGGWNHVYRTGVSPHLIVGDFDSACDIIPKETESIPLPNP